MNGDKAGLILNAIGIAVLDLMGADVAINKENLIERLEQNRRASGNVVEKMANRDAAELVRNSSEKFLH